MHVCVCVPGIAPVRRFLLFSPSSRSPCLYSSFFLAASSPWATWSRSSRYGNRAESRWKLTPPLSFSYTYVPLSPLTGVSAAPSLRHVFHHLSLSLSLPSLCSRSCSRFPSFFNPTYPEPGRQAGRQQPGFVFRHHVVLPSLVLISSHPLPLPVAWSR